MLSDTVGIHGFISVVYAKFQLYQCTLMCRKCCLGRCAYVMLLIALVFFDCLFFFLSFLFHVVLLRFKILISLIVPLSRVGVFCFCRDG